jgi:hypothetical protein
MSKWAKFFFLGALLRMANQTLTSRSSLAKQKSAKHLGLCGEALFFLRHGALRIHKKSYIQVNFRLFQSCTTIR